MVSTRLWGAGGILLALVGVVIIAPDALHSLQEGVGLEAIYGGAVLLVTLLTLLVVGAGIAKEA